MSESSHSSDNEDSQLPSPSQYAMSRLRGFNPLRLFRSNFQYQQIPSASNDAPYSSSFDLSSFSDRSPNRDAVSSRREAKRKFACRRLSTTKIIALAIASIVVLALLGGGGYHHHRRKKLEPTSEEAQDGPFFYWMHYFKLDGAFNGVRTLVPHSEWIPDNRYNQSEPPAQLTHGQSTTTPSSDLVVYDPYPKSGAKECYLDEEETIRAPDVFAYPGIPQQMSEPLFGSYKELGLEDGMCFDRFGRLAAYGFGYDPSNDKSGPGNASESAGSEKIFERTRLVNYTNVDWGRAQRRCVEKNKARFELDKSSAVKKVSRQAYVLRTWTGYEYTEHQILTLRAMITELNLKSGGEYDVHFLVHVKDDSLPIWASDEIYQRTLQESVPREFWNISTLWSEQQMRAYYPGPFGYNFANMVSSNVHGVYRSAHFALQWFSQQHPEYEHFWNWEMDVRYTGHYWAFNHAVGEWAQKQPRKGLWERSRRFWIPQYHGDYQNFTQFVERDTAEVDIPQNNLEQSGPMPIWGPVQDFPNNGLPTPLNATKPPTTYAQDAYEWGVNEPADLVTFNPIFDPSLTNWVFRNDATGYSSTSPIPPRRAAIITVARLSARLLHTMHAETALHKHTMFAEMWPASVALHHGLKAVYVPHPVYFDRDWEVGYAAQVFNRPSEEWASPFGWGENNMLGGSWYYNSGFAGGLWRRWLGLREGGRGGRAEEEGGTGRMCLRGVLVHPVKREEGDGE